jgi:hypothetical protein
MKKGQIEARMEKRGGGNEEGWGERGSRRRMQRVTNL